MVPSVTVEEGGVRAGVESQGEVVAEKGGRKRGGEMAVVVVGGEGGGRGVQYLPIVATQSPISSHAYPQSSGLVDVRCWFSINQHLITHDGFVYPLWRGPVMSAPSSDKPSPSLPTFFRTRGSRKGGPTLCPAVQEPLRRVEAVVVQSRTLKPPDGCQIGILPPTYLPPPITLPHHPTSSFISLYFCPPHPFTLPTTSHILLPSPHSIISLPTPPPPQTPSSLNSSPTNTFSPLHPASSSLQHS
ncbi:hypothetical protein EYF80_002129 [Liparis tanakae]|uniref:Uncharacterized protein n=1 Tax=Liparis tanakae TaxID=230148 RepID=A0A4Z2JET8_9TELE|nr:hypothetical protein EYF80_002129 [Liparis tanakae]